MLLNTSTSGVTESPFLPPFFHTLQITFIVPGFVRTEGEGPAPEIILYECLTDTSPDGISRLPVSFSCSSGMSSGKPASDTSAGRQQFYYGNVLPFFPASHPAGTSHSYAGMMRRLRDTLTQGKIGTALIGIKRPLAAPDTRSHILAQVSGSRTW